MYKSCLKSNRVSYFEGHSKEITQLSIFHDDSKFVSSSQDFTSIVWDVNSLSILKTLKGHTDSINSVCLTSCSTKIITASSDKTAIVWEVSSGNILFILKGHSSYISSVCTHKSMVITGSGDKSCIIWDLYTGEVLRKLSNGHSKGISTLSISKDGERLVTGGKDHNLVLWDCATGFSIQVMKAHSKGIKSIEFSADNRMIISVSSDKSAIIWDASNGKMLRKLLGHTECVKSLSISKCCTKVVTGGVDCVIIIWDISTGIMLRKIEGIRSIVTSVVFSSDSSKVIAGLYDSSIILWDSSAGEEKMILEDYSDVIISVSTSQNERQLSSEGIRAVCISSDGQRVIIGSFDNSVSVYNSCTGDKVFKLIGHSESVTAIASSSNEQLIVSGAADGCGIIWDANKGISLYRLVGHKKDISAVKISSDSLRIFTGSFDKCVFIWDAGTGILMRKFCECPEKITSIDLSWDDSLLAVSGSGRYSYLWNTKTGANIQILKGHKRWVTSIAFSPDSSRIVAGSKDCTAKVWDVIKGRMVLELVGHTDEISSVMYSPNGIFILTGAEDGKTIIWSSSNGIILRELEGPGIGPITSVSISKDLFQIVTASSDNSAIVWFEPYLYDLTSINNNNCCVSSDFLYDMFMKGLESSKKGISNPWGFLLDNMSNNSICELLYYDEQLISNRRYFNILHVATQYQEADVFLKALFLKFPHLSLLKRNCEGVKTKGSKSLLARAIDNDTYSCIKIILEAYIELLDYTTDDHENDNSSNSISVYYSPYLGETALEGCKLYSHFADEISINEICRLVNSSPELFTSFIKKLTVVNNYMISIQTSRVPIRDTFILKGSNNRVEHEFWEKHYKDFKGDELHVKPYLVPIQNIAGKESKIIESLLQASDALGQYKVFDNEVIKYLIEYKWEFFILKMFLVDFLVFILSALLFTFNALSFSTVVAGEYDKSYTLQIAYFLILLNLFLCLYFARSEVLKLSKSRDVIVYFSDGWNILHSTVNCLMIFTLSLQLHILSNGLDDHDHQVAVLSSITMPFLAAELLFYMSGFKSTGSLVRMIIRITKSVKEFSLILFIIMLAFACSFFLLFEENDPMSFEYDGYTTLDRSLMTVFGYLFSTYSLEDLSLSKSSVLSQILLCLFLFQVDIILLNLLIAIMGDKYEEVQQNSEGERYYALAKLIYNFEGLINEPEKIKNESVWYPKWIQILQRDVSDYSNLDNWMGRVQTMKTYMDNRIHSLELEIANQFKELKDLIDFINLSNKKSFDEANIKFDRIHDFIEDKSSKNSSQSWF